MITIITLFLRPSGTRRRDAKGTRRGREGRSPRGAFMAASQLRPRVPTVKGLLCLAMFAIRAKGRTSNPNAISDATLRRQIDVEGNLFMIRRDSANEFQTNYRPWGRNRRRGGRNVFRLRVLYLWWMEYGINGRQTCFGYLRGRYVLVRAGMALSSRGGWENAGFFVALCLLFFFGLRRLRP